MQDLRSFLKKSASRETFPTNRFFFLRNVCLTILFASEEAFKSVFFLEWKQDIEDASLLEDYVTIKLPKNQIRFLVAEYLLENGRFLSAKCSTNNARACDLKAGELL